MVDPFHLQRFVDAQSGVFLAVRAELRRGRKTSHWMWFIFPQLRGLGFSAMAQRYAISGIEEAQAYLEHAVLAPRLRECVQLVNHVEGRTVHQIFGTPDDLKFRSSMTLFAQVPGADPAFAEALQKYFAGNPDPRTLELLRG